MGKKLLPVWVFGKVAIRRAFRDKTAMFFLFMFPLIFLFIFGGIFGKNSSVSFHVALINQSDAAFSKQFVSQLEQNKAFKIDVKATSLDQAREKLSRGQLDAAIVLPPNFGDVKDQSYPSGQAKIYYTNNSQQAAQTLQSVLSAVFGSINQTYVKAQVPFSVTSQELNTKSLRPFDYTFAGLLGFTIIGLGIFGPVNYFPELKKQGVLRRLHTTPLRVWQFFSANVFSQSVIGLLSVLLMFIAAIIFFHLKVSGNVIDLVLFTVFSIITILGIGLAIGGWAKDQNQSAPLTNIIVFPMFFLSGTFFPRFLMPQWLQKVSTFLPLTPVIDGMRLIITEGKHLWQIGPQLGLMAIWTIVIYFIAFKIFRWE
ncbi:MAG TPA: ABC transporter permease [Patescibacteria group bacterium]|nr:ABC transporter permease [Patescibacteria group bacterium]